MRDNQGDAAISEQPVEWPPLFKNRATRRRCEHRFKWGYCVDCGTPVSADTETER